MALSFQIPEKWGTSRFELVAGKKFVKLVHVPTNDKKQPRNYTDIDLWGGGPPSERNPLRVSTVDSSMVKVSERPFTRRGAPSTFSSFGQKARSNKACSKAFVGQSFGPAPKCWFIIAAVLLRFSLRISGTSIRQRISKRGCASHVGTQCAIKLSASLKKVGMPIDRKAYKKFGQNGKDTGLCEANKVYHARGARPLADYLWSKFGHPEVIKSKKKHHILGRKGIVFLQRYSY